MKWIRGIFMSGQQQQKCEILETSIDSGYFW